MPYDDLVYFTRLLVSHFSLKNSLPIKFIHIPNSLPPSRRCSLLLGVPHTEDQQVLVLQIVTSNGGRIRKHLPQIRYPDLRERNRTACVLHDTISKGRDQQIERQIRDSDHPTIELPLGFRRVIGKLYLQGDRML